MYKNGIPKITNLLGNTIDKVSKLSTKKWVENYDQFDMKYNTSKEIRFETSMLRSYLCDYYDAYIIVKGKVTVAGPNDNAYDKKLNFRNNAPFISCISKINNTLIDNAEDLDIAMQMYNLIEYNKNYSKTSGSLWNYYRDEPNNFMVGNINYSISNSKNFDYKTSITEQLEGTDRGKNIKIVIPLKYLSTF